MATPGLIQSQQPKPAQPLTPRGSGSQQTNEVKPALSQVDAGSETVESRLNKMTETGSKYTDLAKNDAIRSSNTRRLINSTMAGAAGTEAAIRAALPIAQQDATTYTDTRFRNQDTENRFLENRQNTNLNKELAAQGSNLRKGEMALGSDLTQNEMRTGSGLTREEMTLQSGLSQDEQAQLSDLTMKRDQGLSELTRQEQQLLSDLSIKQQESQSTLDIRRDNNSASLNESIATLENVFRESEIQLEGDIKSTLELALNDARFSDETKLQMVRAMESIITNTQAQITEIGLSDRTAEAQAAAIKLAEDNRTASLAVYENLLSSFGDWAWGTDFTPDSMAPGYTPPPPEETNTSTFQTDEDESEGEGGESGL